MDGEVGVGVPCGQGEVGAPGGQAGQVFCVDDHWVLPGVQIPSLPSGWACTCGGGGRCTPTVSGVWILLARCPQSNGPLFK